MERCPKLSKGLRMLGCGREGLAEAVPRIPGPKSSNLGGTLETLHPTLICPVIRIIPDTHSIQGYTQHPISQTLQGLEICIFNNVGWQWGKGVWGGGMRNSDLVQPIHFTEGEAEVQKGGGVIPQGCPARASRSLELRPWESGSLCPPPGTQCEVRLVVGKHLSPPRAPPGPPITEIWGLCSPSRS